MVAAPTHGAVGVIPAVLHCYDKFMADATNGGVIKFLLTAAATGILYKRNASISDAKVAFEGEVGVAMFHGGGWFGGRSDELEAGYEDALLLITRMVLLTGWGGFAPTKKPYSIHTIDQTSIDVSHHPT